MVGEAITGADAALVIDCFEIDELRESDTSVESVAKSAVPFGFLPLIVGDAVAGLEGVFLSSEIFRISTGLPFFAFDVTVPLAEVADEAVVDFSLDFFLRTVLLREGVPPSLIQPLS